MQKMIKKLFVSTLIVAACALILYPKLKNKLLSDIIYLKSLIVKRFETEDNISLDDILSKAVEYEKNINLTETENPDPNIENAISFYIFAIEKFKNFDLNKFSFLCKNDVVKENVMEYFKDKC
ncbi:hypothetical protein CDIK_0857 [Cucumispora dikerogammari]|nr:hypothetical protein CDIK_0857 [Cucumispora dikerogammari]